MLAECTLAIMYISLRAGVPSSRHEKKQAIDSCVVRLGVKLFYSVLSYFDGDLRTDSEEEEEEISDVGTVNPCWQNAP